VKDKGRRAAVEWPNEQYSFSKLVALIAGSNTCIGREIVRQLGNSRYDCTYRSTRRSSRAGGIGQAHGGWRRCAATPSRRDRPCERGGRGGWIEGECDGRWMWKRGPAPPCGLQTLAAVDRMGGFFNEDRPVRWRQRPFTTRCLVCAHLGGRGNKRLLPVSTCLKITI
jgi:hypothetical protein